MKNLAMAVALVAALLSSPLVAKEEYAIRGVGASSCGQWIEGRGMHDKGLDNIYISWLFGFLSGLNAMGAASGGISLAALPDAPSTLAYIDKYCAEHPLKDITDGALAMFFEINRDATQPSQPSK